MEVRKTFQELEGFVEAVKKAEVDEVFFTEQTQKTENGNYVEFLATAVDLKLLPKGDSFLKTNFTYYEPVGIMEQLDEKTYEERKLNFFNKLKENYNGKVYRGGVV